MNIYELFDKVTEWGDARGINNAATQANKVSEEWGETLQEFNHNRFGDKFIDGIGDTLVSLTIFAHINGVDIRECFAKSYEEIKDREGINDNGNFIRNE